MISRRDFFRLLGGGLAVLVVPVGLVTAPKDWQDQIHDEFCRRYPHIAKGMMRTDGWELKRIRWCATYEEMSEEQYHLLEQMYGRQTP